MRAPSSFMSLPALLLLLVSAGPSAVLSNNLEWPYNLPPHVKYYPEDEVLVKRSNEILRRLQQQPINGVRKMSADPGEKFYLEYWSFEGELERCDANKWSNSSLLPEFIAPLPLHWDRSTTATPVPRRSLRLPFIGQRLNEKRDFVCPTGTQSCSSINRPNTCCPNSSTCQIVPDTGLGDVGCCDAQQTCAGSLSSCPVNYTSCPNNPGGGCCLPGYACYQEGCVLTSTTVVIVSPPTSTSTSTTSTTPTVSPSTATSTVIVTASPSSATASSASSSSVSDPPSSSSSSPETTTTTTQLVTTSPTSTSLNTLICSTGFRSCPASLGGGCCPTDRACGRDVCPELSSSASPSPPVRPTTVTTSAAASTTTSQSESVVGCPTGFYACSAYYQGGCCQVGRDCAQTSCPTASATVLNSNGVTAVAPTTFPAQTTLLTGSCATGWSSCAASVGGGCCPAGYACGTAACSATASGGAGNQVGKTAPNGSATTKASLALIILCGIGAVNIASMIGL